MWKKSLTSDYLPPSENISCKSAGNVSTSRCSFKSKLPDSLYQDPWWFELLGGDSRRTLTSLLFQVWNTVYYYHAHYHVPNFTHYIFIRTLKTLVQRLHISNHPRVLYCTPIFISVTCFPPKSHFSANSPLGTTPKNHWTIRPDQNRTNPKYRALPTNNKP